MLLTFCGTCIIKCLTLRTLFVSTFSRINRIGDDSVRYLSQLAQGYSVDDFYAFRDGSNQLTRRRLPASQHRRQNHQYQPEPSYHVAQSYIQEEQEEEDEEEFPDHYEGPEGHPYKDTVSMVFPDDEEEAEHPYRHKYDFATSASEVGMTSSSTRGEDQRSRQLLHKVAEFPYEFHTQEYTSWNSTLTCKQIAAFLPCAKKSLKNEFSRSGIKDNVSIASI